MMVRTLMVAFFIGLAGFAQAQVRYGIKTGLNFARMDGPSEMNDAGESLESWQNISGFHIGATFSYLFTDNYGVRGELLYSKKGARYTYDGQTFRNFTVNGNTVLSDGTGTYRLNINNSYLDIPVTLYARWGDFELSGGVYASLLLQSVGEGSHAYMGRTAPPANKAVEEIKFILDHNYRRDDPGQGDTRETILVNVNDNILELPRYLGAYYDLPEDKGSLYNTLDYGVTGGVSYFLSRALYANVRLQYGLADLTNNDADYSKARNEQGNLIYRDDRDRNFTIQASIGFSF